MLSLATRALRHAHKAGYVVQSNGDVMSSSGRCRRLFPDKDGYLEFSVRLAPDNKVVNLPVHRLVAYQKFGDALFEDGIQVRHLDGNRANNTWGNIAIGTQSENARDRPPEIREEHGRLAGRANSHLSDQDVLEIRQKFSIGATLNQIMKEYNIAKSTASYIKNYKTYKYLVGP